MTQPGKRLEAAMIDLKGLRQAIDDSAAQLLYGPPLSRLHEPVEPGKDDESIRRKLQADLVLAVGKITDALEAIVEIAGPDEISAE
jgi:hypothetical protein